jgi:hypothetical protein
MPAPTPIDITVFENALYTWFREQTGLVNVRWADQDSPVFSYPYGVITPLTGFLRNANAFDYTENGFDTILSGISESYTIVAVTADTLTITISGSAPVDVTLTAGTRTAAQIASDINLTPSVGVIASDVGGNVQIISDNGNVFTVNGNAASLFDFDASGLSIFKRGYREVTVSFQAYVGPPDNNNPAKNANFLISLAQGSLQLDSVRDTFKSDNIAVIEDLGITRLDQVIEDTFVSIANLDIRFLVSSSVFDTASYIKKVLVDSEFKNPDGTIASSVEDQEFGILT